MGEAKKKSKIFLDLARKKLCHVVGNIFLSNFVMYFNEPFASKPSVLKFDTTSVRLFKDLNGLSSNISLLKSSR